MNKVLQFTCLKMHFENLETFSPVLVLNGYYQLQSANSVLCGLLGNAFNFTSIATARAWIDDNLAKLAKSGQTSEDYILKLIIEDNANPQPYIKQEIAVIQARNAGDWSVYFADELTENFELGLYIPESVNIGLNAEQVNAAALALVDNHAQTVEHYTQEQALAMLEAHAQGVEHYTQAEIEAIVQQSITSTYSVNPMIEKVALTAPVVLGGAEMLHGFSRAPDLITASLFCVSPQYNFAVGDEVNLGQYSPQCWCDATKIGTRVNSTSFRVFDKSTSSMTVITAAKWVIVVKAFKFN